MPKTPKLVKLNLGCGFNKIDGFTGIDVEKSCNPDILWDILKNGIPCKNSSVDEIVLFHTIEHITKKYHVALLKECFRVLKPKGLLYITYPEFIKCVDNWKKNYRGLKDFWEATIFGRQLYPSDTHVCIMHTPDFIEKLADLGFTNIVTKPEPTEKHNTMVSCRKGLMPPKYEDLVKSDMEAVQFIKSTKRQKR